MSRSVLSVDRRVVATRGTDGPAGADTRSSSPSAGGGTSGPDASQAPDLPIPPRAAEPGTPGGARAGHSGTATATGSGSETPTEDPSRAGERGVHTCGKLGFLRLPCPRGVLGAGVGPVPEGNSTLSVIARGFPGPLSSVKPHGSSWRGTGPADS